MNPFDILSKPRLQLTILDELTLVVWLVVLVAIGWALWEVMSSWFGKKP